MSPVAAEVASAASAPGAALDEAPNDALEEAPAAGAPAAAGVLVDEVAEDPQPAIRSSATIAQTGRSFWVKSMLASVTGAPDYLLNGFAHPRGPRDTCS